MYCSNCGGMVPEGASFCSSCGQPIAGGGVPVAGVPVTAPPASVAMPQYTASIPQPQVLYAGFWLRFVAYLIDSVILGIPFVVVIALLVAVTGAGAALSNIHPGQEPPEALIALLGAGFIFSIVVVALFGGWLYYGMMESSSWQATLGKKALGLYVTDMEGRRISFARASGRFFAKIITGLIPLAIGYIMAGFTAKKQALHDMIAGCLVLRKA
jgi:uncharacterized RDD family membrane protein YckC